ncbi:MAG: MptD family putative ECF transporter S component [Lachnospiraceae bacterium]|nr:MptD family putative ECF transporter S component [Lachnospiraceae bacterium]MBQ6993807.1 MptD family putative ECF transporter S component [Lachnospiraceae bacterium]
MSHNVTTEEVSKGFGMKDMIVTGVFAALILILSASVGGVFAINPMLTFFFPMGAALLPGPVFMLYLAKVRKRGGLSIIGIVIAVLVFITGMHWGMAVGSVVCAIIADLVSGSKNYADKRVNVLAYIIYSFGTSGSYIAFFANPDAWARFMIGNGTTQEYINTMKEVATGYTILWMLAGTAIVAALSGGVGCHLMKKQFEKAGIVA